MKQGNATSAEARLWTIALAPAILYAFLADVLLPAQLGTSKPKVFLSIFGALIVVGFLVRNYLRSRAEGLLGELQSTIDALIRGDYSARARVPKGPSGAMCMLINRLAARLEETTRGQDGEVAAARRKVADLESQLLHRSIFFTDFSEDLLDPLSGIIELGALSRERHVPPELAAVVGEIVESSKGLMSTLQNVADFSRIETGRIKMQAEDFGLHLAINTTIGKYVQEATRKGLKIKCKIAKNVPPQVCGDQGRFRQIIAQFLGNAIAMTDAGEISVLVTIERETVCRTTLRVAIMDTGSGIDVETARKMLSNPFAINVEAAAADRWASFGLATGRELAELMGGSVGVESSEGRGSQLWFTVTFEKSAAGGTGAPKRDRADRIENALPVMAVTQNPDRAAEILAELTSAGLVVHIEDNRSKFAEVLQESACGLVLIDGERPELVATMATWIEGAARQIPVIGIPNKSNGSVDRQRLLSLVYDWLDEDEILPEAAIGLGRNGFDG